MRAIVRNEPRDEVELEIDQLIEEGVMALSDGKINLATQYMALLDCDVETRLDSLRHFLDAVTQTVYQRFFGAEQAIAFARVLSFQVDEARLSTLRDAAYAAIREGVVSADAEAGHGARNATVAFCISETPQPFLGR